jgi:hypothetical protein
LASRSTLQHTTNSKLVGKAEGELERKSFIFKFIIVSVSSLYDVAAIAKSRKHHVNVSLSFALFLLFYFHPKTLPMGWDHRGFPTPKSLRQFQSHPKISSIYGNHLKHVTNVKRQKV